MQPIGSNNQIASTANNNVERGLQGIPFPVELAGIIPEGVWMTLSPVQQNEVLKQHGLTHYIRESAPENIGNLTEIQNAGRATEIVSTPAQEAPRIVDNNSMEVEKQKLQSQFESVVDKAKQLESEHQNSIERSPETRQEKPVTLSEEEKQRIAAEQGKALNQGTQGPKLFGYSPSQNLISTANDVADDGSVYNASTWTAGILKKLWAMLGIS